ncbi:class I SAM-dependent methyltransferase [Arcanobacterium hippocoleae]|uniref:Demethylmenaquinone methyltransferase n=1 Tax=Arcanobacterium hippocoleae TaxID=149017 RepID=A0ABU1T1M8_9ACTO|nr:class I SAM-dependent methyltransferase [Arcanobacterium hippocoleae]MDR6939287.1 demethylmenaquinone methyltransferase/2-methoxy-6-polyprenyl-1,4-benzoquinol methylase [Arcanobacterium hippocoleae]
MSRADLEKNPKDVSRMFNEVARKYDLMNVVLTGGLVFPWRKVTTAALEIEPGMKILDIAAGTGSSTAQYAAAGADVIGCDFSAGMIEEGRRRHPQLKFVTGDATDLDFADNSFDATTISYGIRNVSDPRKALSEMLRVTKPGGKLVVCEFSRPVNQYFFALYKFFLHRVMPIPSKILSSDAPAYDYLMESILDWPDQCKFSQWLREAGWENVEYKNLTGGIVAIHRARKPN